MSLVVPKLSNSLSEFNLSHPQNSSLKSLPEELMVNIFKLLSINDLNSLVKTCRIEDFIQSPKIINLFGSIFLGEIFHRRISKKT